MKQEWELLSPFMRRVVAFKPATAGLYTADLEHRLTGTRLFQRSADVAEPDFSMDVNGQPVTPRGREVRFLDASQTTDARGSLLVVQLDHIVTGLDIQVHYHLDHTYPVMRKWLTLTNHGSHPVTLRHLCFERLEMQLGATREMRLLAHYGSQPRELLYTGRVDDPLLRLTNARTGECALALNEASGHLKRTEHGAWFWDGELRWMFDTDLFPFERHLQPGESFVTPAALLVLGVEGQGTSDPRWILPAYTAEVLRRKRTAPPWIYNTWDPFGIGIDATAVNGLIPAAARMGFDVFSIDDGWQAEYGANLVSPERFPKGLDSVLEAVEAAGMRLGLWASLAAVDPEGSEYRNHPEWRCLDGAGQPKFTRTAAGMMAVMCLGSGFHESAAARLIELVERYRLAYLKLDLTTVFNAYGEAPGCSAVGHVHQSAAESVVRIYEGIRAVTDAIYARCPDVWIDLTFELWGQKHTIDYGLLAAADLDWLSNVGDTHDEAAGPLAARLLLYQRALAVPVESMLIGNLRATSGDWLEHVATAAGSAPLLLGDLRELSPAQQDQYGTWIRAFKALRQTVALDQSFFPLGAWNGPNAFEWDGYARLSREGEGLIVLFRNDAPVTEACIRIPIPGEASYRLETFPDGAFVRGVSAAELRAGLPLPLGSERVRLYRLRQ